jgi:hypothetical protein
LLPDHTANPIHYPALAEVHARICSLPLRFGFVADRWQYSANLMLEKSSGRLVHKLRIIHLFEADFNFVLKLIWGKRLMRFGDPTTLWGRTNMALGRVAAPPMHAAKN